MPQTVKKEEFDELKGEVEQMKENIELLSNPGVLEELAKAKKRIEEGFEEAREEGGVGRPKKDIPEEKLGKMYKRGASYKFMASEFDVSVSTVKRRLKEYGII